MDLEITVAQAKSLLSTEHPPLLLDVREPWEHQTAHIEPSTLIPMNEIPGRAHQELDEEAQFRGAATPASASCTATRPTAWASTA